MAIERRRDGEGKMRICGIQRDVHSIGSRRMGGKVAKWLTRRISSPRRGFESPTIHMKEELMVCFSGSNRFVSAS